MNPIAPQRFAAVALVGAGPGAPELLTLRGHSLLSRADVVLYDGLSNPELLKFAPQAETICVGKHGQSRIWSQPEINREMIRHARRGRRVVRLKGGDPAVFARTAEEIEALRASGIPFEIVPGITAALAASSYAGIPVTQRGLASAVALVTGHEEPGKAVSSLDWEALAKFPGTLVMYMGVTTAGHWTSQLLQFGKPPETPAVILRRCSLPDQRSIECRLDEVAGHLTPATKVRPPVIVLIGPVARLAAGGSWFSNRPLFGQRVLVTRAEDQADELTELLGDLGAQTLIQPAITIDPLDPSGAEGRALDARIAAIDNYAVIAFSSRNGVAHFFRRLFELGYDVRVLAGCRIAAVGQRTAESLRGWGVRADLVPASYSAEDLVAALGSELHGLRVLAPRASRGGDTLRVGLEAAGAQVDEVVCYLHRDVETPAASVTSMLERGQISWTTVTSSAIARSLVGMFGERLRQTQLASLSPKTSGTLRQLGFPPAVEAEMATMRSLCEAIAATPTVSAFSEY